MEINGAAGKYPVRDIWSNDGGGRALEDQRRYGDRMLLEASEKEYERSIEGTERALRTIQAEFARRQSAFAEKYGTDALGQLAGEGREAFLKGRSAAEVKQLLTDLSALETVGAFQERVENLLEGSKTFYRRDLVAQQVSAELTANSYDARFLADDEGRLAAHNRAQTAQTSLIEIRLDSERSNAAREAGRIAEAASLKDRLGPPSSLYSVNSIGAVEIDFLALEKIGPGEAATSELARLIGVLAERNGLGQLRDGLIGIVNGQNRRLAERNAG
jgi:hypothetical protein